MDVHIRSPCKHLSSETCARCFGWRITRAYQWWWSKFCGIQFLPHELSTLFYAIMRVNFHESALGALKKKLEALNTHSPSFPCDRPHKLPKNDSRKSEKYWSCVPWAHDKNTTPFRWKTLKLWMMKLKFNVSHVIFESCPLDAPWRSTKFSMELRREMCMWCT